VVSDEKRANPRVDVQYPVRVTTSRNREFDGTVANLGGLGALVSTPDLEAGIEVGDRVKLAIEMPSGTVEVEGELLRLDQEFTGGDITRTFAVLFDEPLSQA